MNRILIIEDDISINKILSHELKNKDYQVDSLYDGKEACQKILQMNMIWYLLIGCYRIKMVLK